MPRVDLFSDIRKMKRYKESLGERRDERLVKPLPKRECRLWLLSLAVCGLFCGLMTLSVRAWVDLFLTV